MTKSSGWFVPAPFEEYRRSGTISSNGKMPNQSNDPV
jgi:hypothetical protein